MKKLLKFVLLPLLVIGLIFGLFLWSKHEPLPEGTPTPEADAMAQKMLEAINYPAWDTTRIVNWTFRETNDYSWNKETNVVEVKWGNSRVLLRTKELKGEAFVNDQQVNGAEADKLVQKAWANFANDSFWLNAPAKAFDPETSRSIVKVKDGREGLMVTYSSGGVTPGDSYVWFMDETGLPTSFKMWVSIIPIGGLEFSWEDWKTLSTGAKVAQFHSGGILEIPITNLSVE